MKAGRLIIAAMVATVMLVLGSVDSRAADTSASASLDVLSAYVWRGQKLTEDEGVAQPSLDVSYKGLGANFWSNYDFSTGENTETDFTVYYGLDIEPFTVSVGYIHYGLDGFTDTQEIYASLGYDVILNPSVTLYYDFDEGEGAFAIISIGHSIALSNDMSVNLGASASINFENAIMGTDSTGDEFTNFYNGELSASLTVPLNEMISIEPKLAWTFPLSSEADDAIEGVSVDGDSSVVYGGVNLTLAF